MVMEVFGNGPGVYVPPKEPEIGQDAPLEEENKVPLKLPKVVNKKNKQENVGNTNNNNMYSGKMSVDSLNPRHRNCFLEGPDYPRSTFSRLGTAGNTIRHFHKHTKLAITVLMPSLYFRAVSLIIWILRYL